MNLSSSLIRVHSVKKEKMVRKKERKKERKTAEKMFKLSKH